MSTALPDPLPPVGADLPTGVELRHLPVHVDARGSLMEGFRRIWKPDVAILQWNLVHSRAGSLRGVHVHINHADYLTIIAGETLIGLRDLRAHSPTRGMGTLVAMNAIAPAALFIPPGVAHGFLHVTDSTHLYGVTHYWDTADELACRWDDPQLDLPWPIKTPLLSDRDRDAPSLATLMARHGDRL